MNILRHKEAPEDTLIRLDELWSNSLLSIESKKYDQALTHLKNILKIDPKNAAAKNRIGIILTKTGKAKRALGFFKQAVKLERSSASLHNLALCYFEIGAYNKSVKFFEEAILEDRAPTPQRLIALAKAYEKTKQYDITVELLKKTAEMDGSPNTKKLFLNAYKTHTKNSPLSTEVINALEKNKLPWDIQDIDSFPKLLEDLRHHSSALNVLLNSLNRKKLSPRSKSTKILAYAYLHNLNAIILLLEKNYSLAASQTARSLCETYLLIGYGLISRSNANYASLERYSFAKSKEANKRLMKKIPETHPKWSTLAEENEYIKTRIKSIEKRYKKFNSNPPSLQEIAIILDKNNLLSNYHLYKKLYKNGSEATHSSSALVDRSITLSGTSHIGIFADSLELTRYLTVLSLRLGNLLKKLPEYSETNRLQYSKYIRRHIIRRSGS